MSGRLIILRHKKWHVWNRENIEKVKKDERLHREELEANARKSRDINAEHIMETLKQASAPSEIIQKTSGAEIVEFKINRQAENEEYRREREEKELLQKRIEGSAPFALGEGSAEMKKIKPWYMEKETAGKSGVETAVIGGKRLQGEAAVAALDRDMARKCAEDPMASFIQAPNLLSGSAKDISMALHSVGDHYKRDSSGLQGEYPGFDHLSGFMGFSSCSGIDDNREEKKRDAHHQHRKKSGNKKSSKKHKKKKRNRDVNSDSGYSSSGSSDERRRHKKKHRKSSHQENESTLSHADLKLLREKRTERERNERIRESLVITKK